MEYLGRVQLGTFLDVYFQALDLDQMVYGIAKMPDNVPTCKITRSSDGAVEYSGLMPVVDKEVCPGLFCSRVFLGGGFTEGTHSIELFALVDTFPYLETRTFEIIAGGDPLGQVLGMAYYHTPSADKIVYQIESGRLMAGKNPRLL